MQEMTAEEIKDRFLFVEKKIKSIVEKIEALDKVLELIVKELECEK